MINVQNVSKTFILHQQNGVRLPVLIAPRSPSTRANAWCSTAIPAAGKSTLLRSLYANICPTKVKSRSNTVTSG
ncbi:phosphonates transport ATP-binding protein PhnL [Escherichia coli]|uniref:Phosphonates transport ATP-binding protein PhnL n=1 Tax=Escherichia coli TaxID=562 RepID=A0A376X8G4_ECOLX|nr:phosphonates transport ATP-binding protein PhnL [Escherichia coli]